MGKRRDWTKVGEVVDKVHELGLSLKDGAGQFGLKPVVLYEYNRLMKRQAPNGGAGVDGGKAAERHLEDWSVQLPEEVQDLIRSHRHEHPTHGFKRIEDELGRPVRHFAYPYGKHDQRVVDAVREAGYVTACTTVRGAVREGADPFLLPRLTIGKRMGMARFLLRLTIRH